MTWSEETDAPGDGVKPRRASRSMRRLWPLGVLIALAALAYAFGAHRYLSLSALLREHETLAALVADNPVATVGAYVAAYIVAVAVSLPGAALFTIVGGYLFGAVAGSALAVVSATIGATIVFLVAKTALGEVLRRKAGRFAQRFAEGFEANAFSYLLLLRLVPIFPFWLVNVAPALFSVSVPTYVAATFLGIIPGTVAYTLVGASLTDVIAALERESPGCIEAGTCEFGAATLFTPQVILAMAALSLVALIPLVVKRVRARRSGAPS